MPKNNLRPKIDIQKVAEQRLIDQKVLRRKQSGPLRKLGVFVLSLAVLFGGAVIGYMLFSGQDLPETRSPEIVLPSETPEPEPTKPVASPIPVVTRQVTIAETPIGFLNVRKGPGITFEKIGQVKPGETYDIVSQNSEKTWYEIKLSSGTGWVIGEYAKEK